MRVGTSMMYLEPMPLWLFASAQLFGSGPSRVVVASAPANGRHLNPNIHPFNVVGPLLHAIIPLPGCFVLLVFSFYLKLPCFAACYKRTLRVLIVRLLAQPRPARLPD